VNLKALFAQFMPSPTVLAQDGNNNKDNISHHHQKLEPNKFLDISDRYFDQYRYKVGNS